jgi:hypothetical protein
MVVGEFLAEASAAQFPTPRGTGREFTDDIAALLRERGISTEPAEGCPVVQAHVDSGGAGWLVTVVDAVGRVALGERRAGTPEVAAGIILSALSPVDVASAAALTPRAHELPGPSLDLQAMPVVDIWESIVLRGAVDGPIGIEGFSLRPATSDVPFVWAPSAVESSDVVTAGGVRIVVPVAISDSRMLDVGIGAAVARRPPAVPFERAVPPLRMLHLGVELEGRYRGSGAR